METIELFLMYHAINWLWQAYTPFTQCPSASLYKTEWAFYWKLEEPMKS